MTWKNPWKKWKNLEIACKFLPFLPLLRSYDLKFYKCWPRKPWSLVKREKQYVQADCILDLISYPLTLTICLHRVKKSLIHLRSFPCISYTSIFVLNLWCGTVSNALEKSKYILSITPPLAVSSANLSRYCKRCVTVDLQLINPNCFFDNKSFSTR